MSKDPTGGMVYLTNNNNHQVSHLVKKIKCQCIYHMALLAALEEEVALRAYSSKRSKVSHDKGHSPIRINKGRTRKFKISSE